MIVGNNSGTWPYIMKSRGEPQHGTIPAVMLQRSHAQLLAEKLPQSVRIEVVPNTEGCVICRDAFSVGDTVMRLPFCFHVFHESCALFWLRRHNTCPTCRKELPTQEEKRKEVSQSNDSITLF